MYITGIHVHVLRDSKCMYVYYMYDCKYMYVYYIMNTYSYKDGSYVLAGFSRVTV